MTSVLSWCRSVMPMAVALLVTWPMLASAQTTSNGATAAPATATSPDDAGKKKTLVATVFGESLYLEQMIPADSETKRKELPQDEFDNWLRGYQAARTYDNVWSAVSKKYVEREKIGVSEAELAGIQKSAERNLKSASGWPDKSLIPTLEQKGGSVAFSRASLIDWKICKALHEKYGGRVGMGSLGAWIALDGQFALLKEHQKAGDITFHHAETESAFWKYAQREHFADTYPKGERLKKLLASPPYTWAYQNPDAAAYSGSIVSHVDSYGSGTGSSTLLSSSGNAKSGFSYGDPSKTSWKGSIKWQLLRREGTSDVYRVEWRFEPKGGTPAHKVEELYFDGVISAKLVVNPHWVISIEPDLPPADGVNRMRIGSALGKGVYRDQLKSNPPTHSELVHLFMAPALNEFREKHRAKFEMTDEEIRKASEWQSAEMRKQGGEQWEFWQKRERERQAELPILIQKIESEIANPTSNTVEKKAWEAALRLAKLEQTIPHAGLVAVMFGNRKFEKYLHCNYGGGRIIHQQFGPEALDARRKLLLELEDKGKFQITDPELRKLAYDYWERPSHPGGFHTDHRILMFPWTKAYQEMVREKEGPVPAKIK